MTVPAIAREKQLKAGSRAKKMALIESLNPNVDELYGEPPRDKHCEDGFARTQDEAISFSFVQAQPTDCRL